jgi:hypothetical protein
MRIGRLVLALALVVASAGACKKSKGEPAAQATTAAPGATGLPGPVGAESEPSGAGASPATAPTRPPPKPKLQIQLRSTPSGAEASVDGIPRGKTPTMVELDDDRVEHDFTFVLPGYAMERYRTAPIKSGVIHARLRPVPADAGPQ